VSNTVSVWLVIVVAFLAANLPFFNQRLLGVVPLKRAVKPLGIRVAELVVLYFIAGGLGLLLEHRAGQIAPQTWEFYAVTGALFITFAFPGFIWRYLWKHKHHG
jgi:TRAP-type C4-dicarboxylate transport system permease small subunit